MLFPPNLSELIDEKHPVKIISGIIDGPDIKSLIKTYKPGGTSCYQPKMLLKVLIYGYLSNAFGKRRSGKFGNHFWGRHKQSQENGESSLK